MFDRFRSTPTKGSSQDSDSNEGVGFIPDEVDALYGEPEEASTPQVTESAQSQSNQPPADPRMDQLMAQIELMNKRMADKDRYIGELRGELTGITRLAGLGQSGGGSPAQEADPPLFDDESIGLIQKGMESDPAGTLTQVAEHVRASVMDRVTKQTQQLTEAQRKQQIAQQVLGNVSQQCNALKREFPDMADVIDDFLQGENPGQNPIGQIIQADPSLLSTKKGLYAAVKAEVLSAKGTSPEPTLTEGASMHSTGNTQVAPPSSSADRRVGGPSREERPIEDRIADSIVQADSHKRDDSLRRRLIG